MKLTRYPVITAGLTALGIATGMGIENIRQKPIKGDELQKAAQQEDIKKSHYVLFDGKHVEYIEILVKDPYKNLYQDWYHARLKITSEAEKLLRESLEKYPLQPHHID